MSLLGLQLFDRLHSLCHKTSLSSVSESVGVAPSEMDFQWLLETASDQESALKKLKDPDAGPGVLVQLKSAWCERYLKHLKFMGFTTHSPLGLLAPFEAMRLRVSKELSKLGIGTNGATEFRIEDSAKFKSFSVRWIQNFFKFDSNCYAFVCQLGQPLKIEHIASANIWVSGAILSKHGIDSKDIFDTDDNVMHWWRLASAILQQQPGGSVPDANAEADNSIEQLAEPQLPVMTLEPILGDINRGYPSNYIETIRSIEQGKAIGRSEVFERLYEDIVAGRIRSTAIDPVQNDAPALEVFARLYGDFVAGRIRSTAIGTVQNDAPALISDSVDKSSIKRLQMAIKRNLEISIRDAEDAQSKLTKDRLGRQLKPSLESLCKDLGIHLNGKVTRETMAASIRHFVENL